MKQKKSLEDLNRRSLEEIEAYIKTRSNLKEDHHLRLNEVKQKWQNSWSEFMDFLVYLETLEI